VPAGTNGMVATATSSNKPTERVYVMSVFIFGLFFRVTFWSEFQFCRMGITRGVSEMMCCDVRVGDSAGITTRYIFVKPCKYNFAF
jgi:hypothetical protein